MVYQFIKGERLNENVETSHEDDIFVYFTDNTRIKKEVLDEFLIAIGEGVMPSLQNYFEVSAQMVSTNTLQNNNWMRGLLDKQKTKQVEMSIPIKLPSVPIIEAMKEESENPESFIQECVEMIVEYNITNKDFLNDIKEGIERNVRKYYNI